jgi:hypothetical protein
VQTALIVIVGWIAAYFVLRWMLQRSISKVRAEFEKEIDAFYNASDQAEAWGHGGLVASRGLADMNPVQKFDDLTPETVSALGQSLSAFVGREVRISSVKKLPVSHAMSNPWAREGCVLVQNSHQLERSRSKARFGTKPTAVRPFRGEVVRRAA